MNSIAPHRLPEEETEPGGHVERRMAVEETRRPEPLSERQCLEVLAQVARATRYLSGRGLLEAFLREMIAAFPGADHCTIVEQEGPEMVARASHPRQSPRVSFTLVRRALEAREAFLWRRDVEAAETPSYFDTASALYAPMVCNGQTVGALHIGTRAAGDIFGERELELLALMATTLGASLKAARADSGQRPPGVFLSYAPADLPRAQQIAADLRRHGVRVWFDDERLRPWDDRDHSVRAAIRGTDAFLLLVSPESVRSDVVRREVEFALRRSRPILPLQIGEAAVLPQLQGRTVVDLRDGAGTGELSRLARMLHELPRDKLGVEVAPVIRILFLAANPGKMEHLDVAKERREIGKRLQNLGERFRVVDEWAVRPRDLALALQVHRPHVLHFAGHGSGSGGLVLEDLSGQGHLVSVETLARLFRALESSPQCVVLNACWSAVQAEALAREVDCVVGTSGELDDESALLFSGGFYQALGRGCSVRKAFDLGCLDVELEGAPGAEFLKLVTREGVDASTVLIEED